MSTTVTVTVEAPTRDAPAPTRMPDDAGMTAESGADTKEESLRTAAVASAGPKPDLDVDGLRAADADSQEAPTPTLEPS